MPNRWIRYPTTRMLRHRTVARHAAPMSTRYRSGAQRSRGSGTVMMLALVSATGIMTVLLGLLGSVLGSKHQLAGVADLAALSAATQPGRSCEVVAELAGRQQVHLDSCQVDATGGVHVSVSMPLRGLLGSAGWWVHARAHAGWRS